MSDLGSRNLESNLSDSQDDNIEALRKMADTHMIVAALIATVTFTAGLTVPGGYYGHDGPNPGMAILTKTKAFKGFIITNTAALMFSLTAITFYFDAARFDNDKEKQKKKYKIAGLFVAEALMVMMIAYVTGTYAVLGNSVGLANATCVIGSIAILINYINYMHYYWGFILPDLIGWLDR